MFNTQPQVPFFLIIILHVLDACQSVLQKPVFKKTLDFWLCWVFVALQGLSLVGERGLLSAVASLVELRRQQLWHTDSAGLACGAWQLLLVGLFAPGMWNLPTPGIELVSTALVGRFLSSVPPSKPLRFNFKLYEIKILKLLNSQCCATKIAPG